MRTPCQRSRRPRQHRVRVIKNYADTCIFANFPEYLRENQKFYKKFFACSYGTQVESFMPKKKIVENLFNNENILSRESRPEGCQKPGVSQKSTESATVIAVEY